MTVVLLPIVAVYGTGAVFTIAIMAGALVILLGLVGLGRTIAYIPWPVIEGFTVGIATIIALQQVPFALDVPRPAGDRTLMIAIAAFGKISSFDTLRALALVGVVLAVMIILPRIRRSLPASLIAVVLATVIAELMNLSITRIGAATTNGAELGSGYAEDAGGERHCSCGLGGD